MNTGYEYVCHQIWAIREENLHLIMDIAARATPSLADIEENLGKKLSNSNNSRIEKKVQVIDIHGPIVKYGDFFSSVSGARSLRGIKKEFVSALENDEVDAILLDVDSPGGEAGGISEFADLVYSSRGVKPIVSYVGDMACSAAYWIASATDKIVCSDTATLGSIGCAAVIRDSEERDKKEGIKNYKFVSSNSPNKRPDLKTDKGQSLIQTQIDSIGDTFIEKVARNRSNEDRTFTFKDVVNKFNKGGVLIGKDAVDVGLADEIGSFESVLNNLGETLIANESKETSMIKEEKITTAEETEISAKEIEKGKEAETEVKKAVSTEVVDKDAFDALQKTNAELSAKVADMAAKLGENETIQKNLVQQALEAKAESEAAKLSDRLVPATKDAFIKKYIVAATDDRESPIEGYSRVESLLEVYNAIPVHGLTSEHVILGSVKDSEEDVDTKEFSKAAEEYAKQLNSKAHVVK